MLQNIRDNSQGWIAKTIIGVIVLLLSLTGFDAIFNAMRTDNLVAKVGDTKIYKTELEQAVIAAKQRIIAQNNNDANFDESDINEAELRQNLLAQLIKENVVLQNVKKFDFAISKQMLDQIIVSMPEFQENGKFSQNLFMRYVQSLGYSVLQFRELLTNNILTKQMQQGIVASNFLTTSELKNFIKREKQTRDFAFFVVKANLDDINPTDVDLENFYQQHKENYVKPEQVIAEYIKLDKSALAEQIKVTDEELQNAYQKHIADIKEQRFAAHILLEVNKERDEAATRAQIEQIAQRIKQGEDFAKVAKEVSEDFITAKDGGDLGAINLGEQDVIFEQAVYSLAQGEVSDPVRTSYGFHLIKVTNIIKAQIPQFASIKDKLEQELKTELVASRFVELNKELENLAYESSDLTQPASELNLELHTSSAILKTGGSDIFANSKVVKALFSDEVLQDGANSAVIDLDPNISVVVRVKEHELPKQLELNEVKDKLVQDFINHTASVQAKNSANDLLAKAKQDPQAVKWQELVNQDRRGQALSDVEKQELYLHYLLTKVFTMPKPQEDKPYFTSIELPGSSDIALIKLSKVHEFDGELNEQEVKAYADALTQFNALGEFNAYIGTLVKNAKVKYYQ